MPERKGISDLLSKVRPPANATARERKLSTFEKLMAVSPLDAEPNISEIARRVSEFPSGRGQSNGPSNGPSNGLTGLSFGQTNGPSTGQSSGPSTGHTLPDLSEPPLPPGITHFRRLEGPRTKSETALWKFLSEKRKIIISLGDLSEETRVPEATLRKVLRRWVDLGLLHKQKAPANEGMILDFNPDGPSNGRSTGQSTFPSKIDRFKNLSISLKTLQTAWPHLAQIGFGLEQIAQIERILLEQGKTVDRVTQGLHHIEYELTHGQLVDKEGKPVADPCSWAFRALAQNGYYRRPKGYVSPEEQALRDQEDEARAVSAARQKADQAQFEAWRDGLTAETLLEAMQGHPGGPKEAWLKKVWRERTARQSA